MVHGGLSLVLQALGPWSFSLPKCPNGPLTPLPLAALAMLREGGIDGDEEQRRQHRETHDKLKQELAAAHTFDENAVKSTLQNVLRKF